MANPRNTRETDIARLRHEKFLTLHVSCSLMIHAVLRHEAIDGRNIKTLEFGRRTPPLVLFTGHFHVISEFNAS